jgi:hypothetical protein
MLHLMRELEQKGAMVTAHRLDYFSFKLLMQSSPIHTLVQF